MAKHVYTFLDVEKMLRSHPKFGSVKGIYVLSKNGPAAEDNFFCTEGEFRQFINHILDAVLTLSSVEAKSAPKEWAPLPGGNKQALVSLVQETPTVYKDFLISSDQIVVVSKIQNEGRNIRFAPQKPSA